MRARMIRYPSGMGRGLPCLILLTPNPEAPFPLRQKSFAARLRLFCLLHFVTTQKSQFHQSSVFLAPLLRPPRSYLRVYVQFLRQPKRPISESQPLMIRGNSHTQGFQSHIASFVFGGKRLSHWLALTPQTSKQAHRQEAPLSAARLPQTRSRQPFV